MSNTIYQEARNELVHYLETQLIGPVGGIEEHLQDAPHKRYLMGILSPPAACVDETDESQDEDSTTEALSNDFKPSSMALSFAVQANSVFDIHVSAGCYAKGKDTQLATKDDSSPQPTIAGQSSVWMRTPLEHTEQADTSESKKISLFDGRARLDVTVRPFLNGKIVTIALSNQVSSGEKLKPEECLYQCALKVRMTCGHIKEYPNSDRFKLDDEQKELELIYRKRVSWAVGHGTSVDWVLDNTNQPIELTTMSMPRHEVKGFSTALDTAAYPTLHADILSISKIANSSLATEDELLEGYEALIQCYRTWIDELDSEELDKRYLAAKGRVIERLRYAAQRMSKGVELLRHSESAMKAFRLGNKAMLMQMIHSGSKLAGQAKVRNYGYETPDYFSDQVINTFQWRPFQLAFQLLVLESLIPDPITGVVSSSHNDVDLLWFPTGGGKTEAYLAVAAWEMIHRRFIHGEKGGGTSVIKRYTLRLLTSQQFQRAGSLICALEVLRQQEEGLGKEPFSLGLWAGEGSSPNTFSKAHEKFMTARADHEPENSFQLQQCPWCGTSIMPKKYHDDTKAYGIRSNQDSFFEFFCPTHNCEFHQKLPIQVVDQALYSQPPSLLIGTIDKFARLTWKAEAAAFFGDRKKLPPSLIIQDELHLISGPLGTIAGIYEAGFDTIIQTLGGKPAKVIAATATIRAAQQQSVRLFGRNVNVFPPSGTDDSDSFFSKEDSEGMGRLYIGAMPSGHTGQTALVQAAAAVLQAPLSLGFSDELLDSYWTVPIYHNSKRELGKSMTLARDDIPERIKVISSEEARTIDWVEELSSGVKGSKIPEVLSNLDKSVPSAVDVLPCTNMISVGVDIERLGLMIVAGQPKATAEYIQASSRVGRDKKRPPGIVLTLYSPTKPRDRSHYETFKGYHQALYRYVEPTSVTPWAKPALERALHAALIAVVRVSGYLRRNESAQYFDAELPEFRALKRILTQRIELAMKGIPFKEQQQALEYLQALIDSWHTRASSHTKEITHFEAEKAGKQFKPLIQSFESNAHLDAWKTLNSMRNVDTETHLYVRGEL